jgi:hypothetical protein
MRSYAALATAVAALATASAAVQTVTIKGNAFFVGSERLYLRGVDYQPGGASDALDPLADVQNCKRDIPLFKELGINTIRVYTVDNSKNHDECMKELDAAGIYLLLDVNTPTISINRDAPWTTYTAQYLQHVFATIDVFSQYDNVLGFFSANEVVNAANNTGAATYVKAVTRDMRNYIKAQPKNKKFVGYSAADVAENRLELAHYLNCGDDPMARSDFFAFNDYSWCGASSYTKSGWDQKVKNYSDYSIPLFLSEFGCNTVSPRLFDEVEALYSSEMTSVFSGGYVYEFSQEPNNYGLVQISTDGKSDKKLQDFTNLQKQYAAAKPPSDDGGYQTGLKPSKCPPQVEGSWEANNTLPAIPEGAKKYLTEGAGKPLGNGNVGTSSGSGGSSSTSSGSASSSSSSSGSHSAAAGRSISAVFLCCIAGASTVAAVMMAL